ncbi:MAG: hypothetical protein HY306_08265 [Nitrosomonadales bacterium]|nr:hypothetical protein [Nitrosomonadales bacterium]
MNRLLGSLLVIIPALTACTSDPYRHIYENIQRRNEAARPFPERAIPPHLPSYKEYKMERNRLSGDVQSLNESR